MCIYVGKWIQITITNYRGGANFLFFYFKQFELGLFGSDFIALSKSVAKLKGMYGHSLQTTKWGFYKGWITSNFNFIACDHWMHCFLVQLQPKIESILRNQTTDKNMMASPVGTAGTQVAFPAVCSLPGWFLWKTTKLFPISSSWLSNLCGSHLIKQPAIYWECIFQSWLHGSSVNTTVFDYSVCQN